MSTAKITTGGTYKTALAYDFDGRPGDIRRDPPGEWVAGTCVGSNAAEIGAQFKPVVALRPEIKKPIWRSSINLHPSDGRLEPWQWGYVSRRFLELLDVDPGKTAWCSVHHSEKPHDHAHLTVSRILMDGSLWDRANDVKRAIDACAQIERESLLLIGRQLHVHDRTPKHKRGLSTYERQVEKKGLPVIREFIRLKVDQVLAAHPHGISLTALVSELRGLGVEATPYLPRGQFKGMSYTALGIRWPGWKLGMRYSNIGLMECDVRHNAALALSPPNDKRTLSSGEAEQSRDKWWCRQKVDVTRSRFGQYSVEHEAALAELAVMGFESNDEDRYQSWLENSSDALPTFEEPLDDCPSDLDDAYGIPPEAEAYS